MTLSLYVFIYKEFWSHFLCFDPVATCGATDKDSDGDMITIHRYSGQWYRTLPLVRNTDDDSVSGSKSRWGIIQMRNYSIYSKSSSWIFDLVMSNFLLCNVMNDCG